MPATALVRPQSPRSFNVVMIVNVLIMLSKSNACRVVIVIMMIIVEICDFKGKNTRTCSSRKLPAKATDSSHPK